MGERRVTRWELLQWWLFGACCVGMSLWSWLGMPLPGVGVRLVVALLGGLWAVHLLRDLIEAGVRGE